MCSGSSRRVILSGVNVWLHSPALCSTVSLPLDLVWDNLQLFPEGARHFLAVLPDIRDSPVPIPEDGFMWFLSPEDPEFMPLLPQPVTRLASAEFQGKCWLLYGFPEAVTNLSDVRRCRLHCFFKARRRGASRLWSREPESDSRLRLYTQGAHRALAAKNLGAWAGIVQQRVPHLPYHTNLILQLVRGLSHTGTWQLGTPPPLLLVYVMVHVHMLCVYIGKTHLAPVQRLRKHGTNATAGAEDSRFHAMLRQTGLHEWTPIPLQYVSEDVEGCFVEREWWFRLKRWAPNDNAPAVPAEVHRGPPPAQKSKRLQQLLEQMRVAQQDGDFARKCAISNELTSLATYLDIPLARTTPVIVPYLKPSTPYITRAINQLVRSKGLSLAQRQAVLSHIVAVRSVPLTVRRAFESAANKQGVQTGRPSCYCSDTHMSIWSAAGDVTRVQGHFCLLPVRINHLDTTLRANDPLPCNGDLSRKGAIKSLHQLAAVLGVPPLSDDHVSLLLPRSEFSEGGELRRRVRAIASDSSRVAVVCIVDKGPAQLWGFLNCKTF